MSFEETIFLLWNLRLPKRTRSWPNSPPSSLRAPARTPLPGRRFPHGRAAGRQSDGRHCAPPSRCSGSTMTSTGDDRARTTIARCVVADRQEWASSPAYYPPGTPGQELAAGPHRIWARRPTSSICSTMQRTHQGRRRYARSRLRAARRSWHERLHLYGPGRRSPRLTDMYSAVTAAIGALKGPLHGGANEGVIHMLKEIGERRSSVDAWVEEQLAQKKEDHGHRPPGLQDA